MNSKTIDESINDLAESATANITALGAKIRELRAGNADLVIALKDAVAALDQARTGCPCTVAERDSGHHVDCYVPELKEALDNARTVLAAQRAA